MALTQITGTGIGSVDSLTPTTIQLGGSGSANALDDYEEGTWTPTVGGNTSYTARSGTYTKIGNLVFIRCQVVVNTLGTGDGATISGLPFTNNVTEAFLGVTYFGSLAVNTTYLAMRTINDTTSIKASFKASSGNGMGVNPTFLGDGTEIVFSGCYQSN